MSVKELLKPNKKRILIFIVLLLVIPIPYEESQCAVAPCPEWHVYPFGGLIMLAKTVMVVAVMLMSFPFHWAVYLLILPVSYLGSCVLIDASGKLRRRIK